MTSDEVRTAFLNFFESKGHKIITSSSLIPKGDPTLLLTTAGMVQFKPYFLGDAIPPNSRLASCQKCFRTTDIESVGDPNHLTFFEMLGNFSVGDYFKREAISWAWEFVTRHLKLRPERLWVTIFLDDEESFHYWWETGVPEQRILRFGEKDNFWGPAGNSGPCGPCSEIHYDFGEEVGCRKPTCAPNCECGRFSEIWNLVFTQYNQNKEGRRTLLPKPNIDTGMGLERTVAAVENKPSVYETDLFVPLLERIAELTGKKYGSDGEIDNAMRVIAEHSRGITFLIADGVFPSNEEAGYVLRRLLRRTALFGKQLGLDKPFLTEIAKTTIKQLRHVYPEIAQRQDFILKVINQEETGFSETLDTGLEMLEQKMNELRAHNVYIIPGDEVFKLHDTYGFSVASTAEIASSRGFSIDREGFEKEMGRQRERAKATHKFEADLKASAGQGARIGIQKTSFVGYSNLKQKTAILSIVAGSDSTETVKEGQEASLILESTPFYGEMGGQVGDAGEIRSSTGRFQVNNTVRMSSDVIVHQGLVTAGSLAVGDEVEAVVDMERRLDIARNHTATHLLQFALRKVLGEHVQQRGSLVSPEQLRFDFSHLSAMTKEEIDKVNHIVNEQIRHNLRVCDEETPYKKAIEEGAIALFDEKYGDVVRVLKIGEPFISTELCGGTHVALTGEIGFFHITSESSIGAGLRRIEAVSGRGAEEFIDKRLSSLENIALVLNTTPDGTESAVSSTASALDMEQKQRQIIERELAKKEAESLLSQVEVVNGVKILAVKVPSARMEILREMSDLLRDRLKSAVVVLGTVYEDRPAFLATVTPDLVDKGYDAGKIVKGVAEVAGGGGGGSARLAQAGGKYKDKLGEALRLVKSLIESGGI